MVHVLQVDAGTAGALHKQAHPFSVTDIWLLHEEAGAGLVAVIDDQPLPFPAGVDGQVPQHSARGTGNVHERSHVASRPAQYRLAAVALDPDVASRGDR